MYRIPDETTMLAFQAAGEQVTAVLHHLQAGH